MKLTLEHLATYLPYGLEVITDWRLAGQNGSGSIANITTNGFDRNFLYALENDVVKIFGLRPISELTMDEANKLIPANKFKFWHGKDDKGSYIWKEGYTSSKYRMNELPYGMRKQLAEWKFDFMELIDKGLAVSINEVVA